MEEGAGGRQGWAADDPTVWRKSHRAGGQIRRLLARLRRARPVPWGGRSPLANWSCSARSRATRCSPGCSRLPQQP
eukprot:7670167-Pyramimonas_sp.AAC.1